MKVIGNVTDRGKKRANYAVLRETRMPAILTENLFIDNAKDAAKLKSDQFLQQVAYGHVIGLEKAFGLKKKAKQQAQSQPQQKSSDKKLYRVQVGAFSDRKNAERLAEELKKKGYPAVIIWLLPLLLGRGFYLYLKNPYTSNFFVLSIYNCK